MVQGYEILKKLTTRNFIAIATSLTLLGSVAYGILHPQEVSTAVANPIITLLIGQFTVVAVLVYNFYFRRSQEKEKTT